MFFVVVVIRLYSYCRIFYGFLFCLVQLYYVLWIKLVVVVVDHYFYYSSWSILSNKIEIEQQKKKRSFNLIIHTHIHTILLDSFIHIHTRTYRWVTWDREREPVPPGCLLFWMKYDFFFHFNISILLPPPSSSWSSSKATGFLNFQINIMRMKRNQNNDHRTC